LPSIANRERESSQQGLCNKVLRTKSIAIVDARAKSWESTVEARGHQGNHNQPRIGIPFN
jgi:hypothetical protein